MSTDENAVPAQADIPVHGSPAVRSPFLAPHEDAWSLILQQTGKALRKRGFGVSIAATLQDAADIVMNSLLPESGAKTVSFGGSMTVREAGLLETLKARPDLKVLDTFDYSIGVEAMLELRRQSLLTDFYLTSVNAMTRDGELLLLDNQGNRTAAVQFGPRKVVLLVGRNKICSSREAAIERVKDVASPANCIRLGKKTPCVKTGHCMDCNSPDRICSAWSIMQRCFGKERIHVVLINVDSGF